MHTAFAENMNPGLEKVTASDGTIRPYGTIAVGPHGVFVWVYATAEIAIGKVAMQKLTPADLDLDVVVPAAVAVGARSIGVTNGATTAATKNMYAGGTIFVNDEAGEGQSWRIKSHAAAATGALLTLALYPDEAVKVALTTVTQCGIVLNPYADAELWDADAVEGVALGVACVTIAATYGGWVRAKGRGSVLADGTLVVGNMVIASDAVDGAVEPEDRDADNEHPYVGVAAMPAGDTEYGLVDFDIPLAY